MTNISRLASRRIPKLRWRVFQNMFFGGPVLPLHEVFFETTGSCSEIERSNLQGTKTGVQNSWRIVPCFKGSLYDTTPSCRAPPACNAPPVFHDFEHLDNKVCSWNINFGAKEHPAKTHQRNCVHFLPIASTHGIFTYIYNLLPLKYTRGERTFIYRGYDSIYNC